MIAFVFWFVLWTALFAIIGVIVFGLLQLVAYLLMEIIAAIYEFFT